MSRMIQRPTYYKTYRKQVESLLREGVKKYKRKCDMNRLFISFLLQPVL